MPRRTYSKDIEEIITKQQAELRSRGTKFLQCQFVSLAGIMHVMEENAELYDTICHNGVDIDGSSVCGFSKITDSDVTIFPDFNTLLIGASKYCDECAEVICVAHLADGSVHPGDARGLLIKQIEISRRLGFSKVEMFGELEFFLVDENTNLPADQAGYCGTAPLDKHFEFRHELMRRFMRSNLRVKRIHHEGSPGQNEVELDFTDALQNADGIMRGMQIIRELAAEKQLIATFSPKPFKDLAGSGLHEHTILFLDSGGDAFYDPNNYTDVKAKSEQDRKIYEQANAVGTGLSVTALHYAAGLCRYGPEMCCAFALSSRSFERLKPGFEAPVWAGWDIANRSALVRIPRLNHQSPNRTRVEFRAGDGSGCPYVLSSLILGAGLRGISEKIIPMKRMPNFDFDTLDVEKADIYGGIKHLPQSMDEAKKQLSDSLTAGAGSFLFDVLGRHALEFLRDYWYTEDEKEPYQPGKYMKHN